MVHDELKNSIQDQFDSPIIIISSHTYVVSTFLFEDNLDESYEIHLW